MAFRITYIKIFTLEYGLLGVLLNLDANLKATRNSRFIKHLKNLHSRIKNKMHDISLSMLLFHSNKLLM